MNAGVFIFIAGLVAMMFGLGGLENSMTDGEVIVGVIVLFVGTGLLYVGARMVQRGE